MPDLDKELKSVNPEVLAAKRIIEISSLMLNKKVIQ